MGALSTVNKFFPRVKKVTDATKKTIIEVTAKDAASKAVKDYGACVMAVACKRKLHLDGVIIARSVAYLIKGDEAFRYQVPASVAREIVSFDRGAGFEVGNYNLVPFPKANHLGRDKNPGDIHTTTGKYPRKFRHVTANIRSVLGGEKPKE